MGCIEPHHIYIGKPLGVSGWNTWPPRPVWRVPSGAKVTPGVGSVHVCPGNLDAVKYLRMIGRLWRRLPRCWRARDTVGTWPALGVLSEHPAFWRGFQLRQIQPLKECSCTKRVPFRYNFDEKRLILLIGSELVFAPPVKTALAKAVSLSPLRGQMQFRGVESFARPGMVVKAGKLRWKQNGRGRCQLEPKLRNFLSRRPP
jgi:hypothetical protein